MQRNEKKEIVSFIEEELNNINQLLSEISECKGDSHIYRRAKGSILHDFYNACERIFEIIARRINGELPLSEQWHKRLLHQMTIEIKGVRPAVISKRLAAELDEYLAFRHLFRNIYGFELESERLDRLVEKFDKITKSFQQEIRKFLSKF
ncbi:MAG: hypothetical protein NC935_04280 [Candidatus Omnitrophica bacterium]|nr:hypothetical protein [Candidatus Omnitrophota bacterium]